MDRTSTQLTNLENTLLKAAEGYKGTGNIKQQLLSEASTQGVTGEDAEAVVDRVLQRLQKTERNRKGGAFGVPHSAQSRTQRIRETIQRLKDF